MPSKLLGTITGEGFNCPIRQDQNGRVFFTADADIDADGANGQNGARVAYNRDNTGSEALANGDMRIVNGQVVFREGWGRSIVILGTNNQPRIFPGGLIASMTWYRHPGMAVNDPAAYVDSETVPFIVIPPLVYQRTAGVVRGCRARVTFNGRSVDGVVADLGPRTKVGELSIAAARAVGIPPNPRTGGRETPRRAL